MAKENDIHKLAKNQLIMLELFADLVSGGDIDENVYADVRNRMKPELEAVCRRQKPAQLPLFKETKDGKA